MKMLLLRIWFNHRVCGGHSEKTLFSLLDTTKTTVPFEAGICFFRMENFIFESIIMNGIASKTLFIN
jgi:hypothetical protein